MKKFLKWTGIVILLIIFALIAFLFIERGKISLYLNLAEKYKVITSAEYNKEDLVSIESLNSMDYKDVEYKNDNGVSLTLDIYGPKKKLKGGSPVILYVHGGSWVYGDKSIPTTISPLLDAFREEGFTIISTSYELMRGNEIFDKQITDIKDTIRWIHKNKDLYGFNENEIGVIGASSGAHLALMASYTDDNEFLGNNELRGYQSTVKYIVDFFGPTDLKTLDLSNVEWDLEQIINSVESNNTKDEIFKKYSPINYIKEDLPKTLIVHSKMDNVVPYENSLKLFNELNNSKNKVEILTLESSNHDFSEINTKEIIPVVIKMLSFIVKNSPL
ncbi:alpha/beta hydrolase [Clostridium carnis]